MACTDWSAPLRHLRNNQRLIREFGLVLILVVLGDILLRGVFRTAAPGDLLALPLLLLRPPGLGGLAALLLALGLWVRLLASYQVSFFYPLWGLATVGVVLVRWLAFDGQVTLLSGLGTGLVLAGAGLVMRGGHSR